jgi:hypothetical protein
MAALDAWFELLRTDPATHNAFLAKVRETWEERRADEEGWERFRSKMRTSMQERKDEAEGWERFTSKVALGMRTFVASLKRDKPEAYAEYRKKLSETMRTTQDRIRASDPKKFFDLRSRGGTVSGHRTIAKRRLDPEKYAADLRRQGSESSRIQKERDPEKYHKERVYSGRAAGKKRALQIRADPRSMDDNVSKMHASSAEKKRTQPEAYALDRARGGHNRTAARICALEDGNFAEEIPSANKNRKLRCTLCGFISYQTSHWTPHLAREAHKRAKVAFVANASSSFEREAS